MRTLWIAVSLILAARYGTATYPVLTAVLKAGKPLLDAETDEVSYHWYAEERAAISPNPLIEVWNLATNQKQNLFDVFPPVGPLRIPNKRFKVNSTTTLSNSHTPLNPNEITPTKQFARFSLLQWWVGSKPFAATEAVGVKRVEPNEDHQFEIPLMTFPLEGFYQVKFNITMYYGQQILWNQTIFVNKQPQKLVQTTVPAGHNGTVLSPAPEVLFRDWVDQLIRTSTPVVQLQNLSIPTGAVISGTLVKNPVDGRCSFKDIVPSIPGAYVFRIVANLSDGSQIFTEVFKVTVAKALPKLILQRAPIFGVTRFVLLSPPIYQIVDSKGLVQDPRTNITLTLGFNEPSVQYVGLSSLAKLTGTRTALPVNYTYTFSDIVIDLPGTFDIDATLSLDDEPFMVLTTRFQVSDLPTWDVETLTVNTIGEVTFYGERPDVDLIRMKLASDLQCDTFASNIVEWPREQGLNVILRNISFVPFEDGPEIFVCMQLPTQTAFVPLLKHYLPRFNELYPTVYSFPITDVASCREISAVDAILYQRAGWHNAEEGRSYGCKLSPPAAGTIPPCTCPIILACESFRHQSFEPPNLNIGRCVCCKPGIMAIAGVCTTLFLFGLLFIIYQWV